MAQSGQEDEPQKKEEKSDSKGDASKKKEPEKTEKKEKPKEDKKSGGGQGAKADLRLDERPPREEQKPKQTTSQAPPAKVTDRDTEYLLQPTSISRNTLLDALAKSSLVLRKPLPKSLPSYMSFGDML